jgi:energy-coupling factor transport system ATP-binding protein
LIETHDVQYTYPNGFEALKGVSLTIETGEFVAIMGENGAGKTTLIKHFNGLMKPTRGSVLVDGRDTKKVTVATLSRDVGLVFQNPDHQLFSETVEDEIAFGLRNFGFDDKTIERRVDWSSNLLNISQYRKTSPFILSGGERKRVALASVLSWDPKIVVLDEPTIGQDYLQKERLRQFIIQLNTQGKTVVIVTHDVEFVADCKPRVVLMSKGRILADGSSEKILTDDKVLKEASIIPPQIAQLFWQLKFNNAGKEIIDVYEATEILAREIKERMN